MAIVFTSAAIPDPCHCSPPALPSAILARATGKDLATCQKEYLNR